MNLDELEKQIEGIKKISWDAKGKILYIAIDKKEYGFPFPNIGIASVIIESMRHIPKLIKAAQSAETLVKNYRQIQNSKYGFDFTPNIDHLEKTLEELEKC
mgnify:CR=1 FL=1|tara:strand:+ start:3599 stop:3901 length:303 start_codon:yes stop_codon:yes gene_type:complete